MKLQWFLMLFCTMGCSITAHDDPICKGAMETNQSSYCNSEILDIVQIGSTVLRNPARELTKEEILSPEIQDLIQRMKATMHAAPGVGLAAPQIGLPLQLAVIEDMDLRHITEEQLAERHRYLVPFHVIINPHVYVDENSKTYEWLEGCLSMDGFLAVVPRAATVRVECLNERAEPIVIEAEGWYARILQHEIDHLNGTLFIDKAQLPTLMTEANYHSLWRGKSIQDIQAELIKEQ